MAIFFRSRFVFDNLKKSISGLGFSK